MTDKNENNKKELTAQEAAIIEMLKHQNMAAAATDRDQDEGAKKKHAFWDTQVRKNEKNVSKQSKTIKKSEKSEKSKNKIIPFS